MAKVVALELLMPVPTLVSAALLDPSLRAGETSSVTFTFSEAVTGFDLNDLTVSNGTLSGLSTADNIAYTATFAPSVGVTDATNVITVNMAGVTSASTSEAGMGTANSANYAIDTVAPTVSISSSTSSLLSGQTATITLTFSEAVTDLSLGDLSPAGGTLAGLTATGDPLVYTAEFTPTGGVSGLLGSVSLAANSYTDLAGNNGGGATSSVITINTLGPSVLIALEHATLKAGEDSDVTFTFSAAPVGFTASDIIVSGGTLSGLANQGGGIYTATFTPASGVDAGVGSISVNSGSYTDGFGNIGGGASTSISFDTRAPTVSVTPSETVLMGGESTLITFTFSEAPVGFTIGDLTATNGTLSDFANTADDRVYTALFTSIAGLPSAIGGVSINGGAFADAFGNAGVSSSSSSIVIDGIPPTVVISSSQSVVRADQTAIITFTFSEAPVGFEFSDLSVSGGTLSPLEAGGNPLVYWAEFTPSDNVVSGTATISIGGGTYHDAAGNSGSAGAPPALSIQTGRPAVSIDLADTALKIGDTSQVTFTFSEAVTGFSSADLVVANGALSNLATNDGGVTWTATLTPDDGVSDPVNVISLNAGGVVNDIGNAGSGIVDSGNYAIDTARPVATITVANPTMQAGQTSLVTFAFSEAVTGFDVSDPSLSNGVLSDLVSADGGITWTATLTPDVGVVDATNLIVLDNSLVADLAGNSGAAVSISNNYQVGYVPPPPAVSENDVISLPPSGGEVAAGPGDDSVSGGAGDDLIQGNTGADTLIGGGGGDIVRGGQGNDFVHGNAGGDLLFGDLGDDTVFGGQGDDFVQGNAGGDYVLGDLGRDTVLGGQGADTVIGGDGDDYLSGDLGDDVLVGGLGADLFNFDGGGGRDVVMDFLHAEGDQIRISPTDAADFRALSAHFAEDGGNTVIELGGQTIVLLGVAKAALTAADFVFG